MNYGLYLAASGASSSMARQDVLSHNLANVGTVGFKPDFMATRAREAARIEDDLMWMDSNAMLEKLGGGVVPTPTLTTFKQGALRQTDDALDIALQGEGFLMVSFHDQTALTRDGRLAVREDGRLVRATDGAPVLDEGESMISVDRGAPVQISADGRVMQRGAVVAQLGVVTVPDPNLLTRGGSGTYLFNEQVDVDDAEESVNAQVMQGFVEESSVDPITTLNGITSASRAAQSNMRMISSMWEIMGHAVNRLGRVN